jgi:hypothetical protein
LQKFHFYAVRESQPRAFFGGVTPSLTLILASANCAPGSDCARFAGQKQVLPFRWRSNIIVDGIGVSYGPVGRWDDVIIAFPESKTTREIYQLDGNVLSALGSVAEIAALVRPAALNIDRLVAKDKTIADLQSAHLEALKELSDERDRRAMAEHIAARKPLEEVLPAGEMERPSNTLLYLVLAAAGFFLLGPMIYQNAPQVGSATNGGILGALLLAGGFYLYQRYRGRGRSIVPL